MNLAMNLSIYIYLPVYCLCNKKKQKNVVKAFWPDSDDTLKLTAKSALQHHIYTIWFMSLRVKQVLMPKGHIRDVPHYTFGIINLPGQSKMVLRPL